MKCEWVGKRCFRLATRRVRCGRAAVLCPSGRRGKDAHSKYCGCCQDGPYHTQERLDQKSGLLIHVYTRISRHARLWRVKDRSSVSLAYQGKHGGFGSAFGRGGSVSSVSGLITRYLSLCRCSTDWRFFECLKIVPATGYQDFPLASDVPEFVV